MKLENFSANGHPTLSIYRASTTSPPPNHSHLSTTSPSNIMGIPFDYAPERPEHIEAILNGLDRYNPETTTIFQDYVQQQCDDKTYDCYANLALLKL